MHNDKETKVRERNSRGGSSQSSSMVRLNQCIALLTGLQKEAKETANEDKAHVDDIGKLGIIERSKGLGIRHDRQVRKRNLRESMLLVVVRMEQSLSQAIYGAKPRQESMERKQ